MAARIKDRIRDFKKVFKENWKLFKQSKLGLIGLGIIIFFVLMAIFAPIIPYAADRDPVTWFAPDEDIIRVQRVWQNTTGGYVITVPANQTAIYPIYDTPVGLLSDGKELNDFLDEGFLPNSFLEVIYLSTGDVGKGVRDISPIDGTYTGLRGGKITETIPADFGAVVSSVRIYHDKTATGSSGAPFNSIIYITSTKGNLLAVRVHGTPPTAGLSEELYSFQYTRLWMHNIGHNMSITQSPAIYYGNQTDNRDDAVVIVGENDTAGMVVSYTMNGSTRWATPLTNGTHFFSPICVDISGLIVVGSEDGHFYGLDATSGSILWHSHIDHEFTTPYMSTYYRDIYDENAVVVAGTTDGLLYGIRLYNQSASGNQTENLLKAGDPQFTFPLPYGTYVSEVFATADHPDTQEIYLGAYVSLGRDYFTKLYSLRTSALINGKTNAIVWNSTEIPAQIHARAIYDPKGQFVFFPLDNGAVYSMNRDGNITLRDTVYPDAVLNTPLLASNIPGPFANVPGILIASTKDGHMQAFSSSGEYLAPLPPGTYPSGNTYLLGTDAYGRDIFSQLIWGSRIALLVGFAASFLSVLIGVIVGVVAGYSGGWVDVVLMRFTDVVLVMPFLPLIIVLAAVMGPSIWNIILAITLVGWPGTARIIRSQVLSLKERPFIDAARVTGASNTRIMFRHIVPNVLPLAFLYMTFAVTGAILGEASLSFIGLGDPKTMSWGMMLYFVSHGYTLKAWWWMLPPGMAITFLVLGFFLVGRAFEEIINPRLRRRR